MKFSRIIQLIRKYPERLFLVLALLGGVYSVFTVPPLFGSDEIVHFPRAFQISEGTLWTEKLGEYSYGGKVPVQLRDFNDSYREQVQNNQTDFSRVSALNEKYYSEKIERNTSREPLGFTSAGVYSPWSYLPSSIGVWVAKTMNLPLIWYVYLGRMSALLIWVLLTFMAIKLLPGGKLFLVGLGLLPTTITQAANLGMDGLVNGLSWLIIAAVLSVIFTKVRVSKLRVIALLLLSLMLATTKQGYLLIAALPLIIPIKQLPFSRQTGVLLKVVFALVLVVSTVLYLAKTGPIADIMHFVQRPGLYVDSGDQIAYILKNPVTTFLMVLIQPFTPAYAGIYPSLVGILTNKQIIIPTSVIILIYIGLVYSFLSTKASKKPTINCNYLRLISSCVFLATFLFINLALYVSFTQVGLNRIEGVQGRYLLPILPILLVFPLSSNHQKVSKYAGMMQNFAIISISIGLVAFVLSTYLQLK